MSVVEEGTVNVGEDKLDVLSFRKRFRRTNGARLASLDDLEKVFLQLSDRWLAAEGDWRVEVEERHDSASNRWDESWGGSVDVAQL